MRLECINTCSSHFARIPINVVFGDQRLNFRDKTINVCAFVLGELHALRLDWRVGEEPVLLFCFDRDLCCHRIGDTAFLMGTFMECSKLLWRRESRSRIVHGRTRLMC